MSAESEPTPAPARLPLWMHVAGWYGTVAIIAAYAGLSWGWLEEGTLYPALHRLERHGWLKADWGTSENGRRARFYSLTQAGRRERTRRTESWSRFSTAMSRVLGGASAVVSGEATPLGGRP